MRIPLDRSGARPLWRQIEEVLRAEIRSGALAPGTRLPSARTLAADLAVSRITVDRAYLALTADGLLVAHPGSGTFVARHTYRPASDGGPERWPAWQAPFQRRSDASTGAAPDAPDDVIAFAGVGDPALFATREFAVTITDVIRTHGAEAFAYAAGPLGCEPLRATVTHMLATQGIHTGPDRVLITSGSQQALFLVCHALLRPGDTVLAEVPTYDGALALFAALGVRVHSVPVDGDGMRVDRLEAAIATAAPKLIYTMPTFQNPTGACMPAARRHRLLEVAHAHEIPVLEDDFVGDLRYDGHAQPALKALDRHGDVIYAGTLSKLLMPGVRIGYVVADGPILDHLADMKRAIDLSTSLFLQRVVDRFVTVGRYQTHLRRSVRAYRARRDALLGALARDLPDASVWAPKGGLFAWVELPEGVSASALRSAAHRRGVDFVPGTRFFPDPADGERFARLNFAVHDPTRIERGVVRLAAAVADVRATSAVR